MPAQNFQYLALDFASHKEALIQRIRARYPGVWNDFFAGSFGILLINIVAWSTALVAYAINRLAGEQFITAMTLRESAVRAGALVGYNLANPYPSTVYCTALLASPAPAPVTLAAGTAVRTSDQASIAFQLAQTYTIPQGQLYPQSTVLTFNPNSSGPLIVQSLVTVTNGGYNVDCMDQAVDLTQYVLPGQVFIGPDGLNYQVSVVSQAPGATANNRLVLTAAWTGTSGNITGMVVEQRIAFVQGQSQQDQFSPASGVAFIATLTGTPVIDGSVSVTVNGTPWQAGILGLADSDAQVYQTRTLPTGQTTVMFGDGTLGAAPPNNSVILVSYLVGGGTAGNISAGSINSTIIGLISSQSSPVTVSVTNQQAGYGGGDAESVNDARLAIPAYTATNGRAVTLADYGALARSFSSTSGQVAYANADVRTQNALLEGNLVFVYAWQAASNGGLTPVAGPLKTQLQNYLQSVAIGTDYVILADGSTQALPYAARVKTAPGYDPATVASDVDDQAAAYVDGLAPGQPAIYSDLLNSLSGVAGVLSVSLAAPSGDVIPANAETALTPPDDAEQYSVVLQSTSYGAFVGQLQFVPRSAWAITATLNGQALTVSPDVQAGFANFSGLALDPANDSTLNLATGVISLYVIGAVGEFSVSYTQTQAYSTPRQTDLYIAYTGDQSQATRRAVRASLRSWADGLAVGAPLYAYPPSVANPATSVADVVKAIPNIGILSQVSLDSPTSTVPQINVSSTELVQLRTIVINSSSD